MKKKGFKYVLSLLMAVLYLGYAASTQLFTHYHYYSWGVVSHSHPFTHAAHTAAQCNSISLLTSSVTEAVDNSFFSAPLLSFSVECNARELELKAEVAFLVLHLLRAPPVSIA